MRLRIASIVAVASAGSAFAEPLMFEGRIEASERGVLASRMDGVVTEILFEGGDRVIAGQPLIFLDPTDAEIALRIADARMAEAEAILDEATQNTDRQEALHDRGIASDATLGPARTDKAVAEAEVALASAEQRRAALDLQRTTILAPISGLISPPTVAVGAFVEAKAGPPLAIIVKIDPAIVAYRASYSERLASLDATGAKTVEDLLKQITVRLQLPTDINFSGAAVPYGASAEVDAETGTVTVWARFPNPDAILRPGMAVTVLSEMGALEGEK